MHGNLRVMLGRLIPDEPFFPYGDQVFLDAVESGRNAEAYGPQAELKKRDETLEQFIQDAKQSKHWPDL